MIRDDDEMVHRLLVIFAVTDVTLDSFQRDKYFREKIDTVLMTIFTRRRCEMNTKFLCLYMKMFVVCLHGAGTK